MRKPRVSKVYVVLFDIRKYFLIVVPKIYAQYNSKEIFHNYIGQEVELTMHDATVRDLCFLEDTSNKSSLLISGGAGDCKIYVTDCTTGTPFQALSGHSGHILTLYNWGGAMFVSGSQDKTVRFWDLRTRGCVNMVTPATVPGSRVSLFQRLRRVYLFSFHLRTVSL